MPSAFDDSKKYQEQQDTFFDDGREVELLHYVFNLPNINSIRGKPSAVLAAIDDFAVPKSRIVSDLIAEVKPTTVVELGGYIGYSCILFGDAVRKAGGKRYFSLERNPEFAAVIMALVTLAGLDDVVKVIIGSSDASIKRLCDGGELTKIDLMFLDHYKPAYTTDLKLCEELGLVAPGTVLAADNVVKPGNPPYLEYVRSTVEQKRKALGTKMTNRQSGFGRAVGQYDKREGRVQLNECKGNPNLVYDSKRVDSYEPSGVPDAVEITRCTGEEKSP